MGQIEIFYEGSLRTRCIHHESGSVILTDAPKDNMGKGELFSPTDLLAAALGSCILTLMGIVAQKLKVDLTGLRMSVEKEMAKAPSRRIGRIKVDVFCPAAFDPETVRKLEEAGKYCPVHHSLHPDVIQEVAFHWGKA